MVLALAGDSTITSGLGMLLRLWRGWSLGGATGDVTWAGGPHSSQVQAIGGDSAPSVSDEALGRAQAGLRAAPPSAAGGPAGPAAGAWGPSPDAAAGWPTKEAGADGAAGAEARGGWPPSTMLATERLEKATPPRMMASATPAMA